MRQRATDNETEPTRPGTDGSASLTQQRDAIDRLFAVAERSFARMSDGNSREFLERSRQTGGQ